MAAMRIDEGSAAYLLERAAIPMLVCDASWRILEANRCAMDLFGPEMVGSRMDELLSEVSGSASFPSPKEADARNCLLHLKTTLGVPETLRMHFVRLEADRLLLFAESNIMESLRLRREFLELNNELTNTARELHKRNAELARLSMLKNHFLGMAAHDLRNPAGAIVGLTDILLEDLSGRVDEELLEHLRAVRSSGEFMLHLLGELLDVSAIEAGKLQLSLGDVDLGLLIDESSRWNRPSADKKGISLEKEILTLDSWLRADASKLRQVVNNLISNAIKYSPCRTTTTVRLEGSAFELKVAVHDQGAGIPPGEISRLFKPFSRTSVRPTGGEDSTGLGLSIVEKIVTAHGGKVGVESEPGGGSTFYFTLPRGKKGGGPA
jgi:signal transduction histidine kinase